MPLALQRFDELERIERDGALRPTVESQIALPIAVETVDRHDDRRARVFRHAAVRSVNRFEPSFSRLHPRLWGLVSAGPTYLPGW